MLDTRARKFVQPLIETIADLFIKINITANQTTVMACIIGVIAALNVYFGFYVQGIILLWISGLLDVIDGTIARKTNTSSSIGTLMDILFDRIVEIIMLLALLFSNKNLGFYISIVFSCIIISMTIFLTVGALTEKKGCKTFYYQAGLAERTEGFIMISLITIFNDMREYLLILFAIMILITAIQRFIQAVRVLK